MLGRWMFTALIQLTLLELGVSSFTIFMLAWRRPSYWWAYAGAKIGIVLVTGTVLIRVYPQVEARSLEPHDWATWAYLAGLALVAGCLIFVCRDVLRRTASHEVVSAWHRRDA